MGPINVEDLSDDQLENLHSNAVRLSQAGTTAQRAAAEEMLPAISEARSRRALERVAEKAEARRVQLAAATESKSRMSAIRKSEKSARRVKA